MVPTTPAWHRAITSDGIDTRNMGAAITGTVSRPDRSGGTLMVVYLLLGGDPPGPEAHPRLPARPRRARISRLPQEWRVRARPGRASGAVPMAQPGSPAKQASESPLQCRNRRLAPR